MYSFVLFIGFSIFGGLYGAYQLNIGLNYADSIFIQPKLDRHMLFGKLRVFSFYENAAAQLYFGPAIIHTSSREWNNNSDEYTTNDFSLSLHYKFNARSGLSFGVNNIVRKGGNRSTEFIRFPLLLELTIEDLGIEDQQLWRLYFSAGGFLAFPTNTDADKSLIDYYSFGASGEIGMAFNFSRGAYGVIGYRTTLDFDNIVRSETAQPQRFADSGIQLGFYMPFSMFSKRKWKKEPYL
mgnify:CR=1 FL=1